MIPSTAGLCASCVHAQAVESSRGSVFVLCRLSLTPASILGGPGDPRFPKYPRLPVVACAGYQDDTDPPKDSSWSR